MFWFEYSEIQGMLWIIYSRTLEILYVSFTVIRPPKASSKFKIVSLMSGKTLSRIQTGSKPFANILYLIQLDVSHYFHFENGQ